MLGVYFLINIWVVSTDEIEYYYTLKTPYLIAARSDITILVTGVLLLLGFKQSRSCLKPSIQIPQSIRYIVYILTGLVAWYYITYDYNFYANQWHMVDRLLIGVLAILSFRYPVVILLLIAQIYVVNYQFNFPLGGSKMLDKLLVLELMKIWGVFHLLVNILTVLKIKFKPNIQHLYIMLIWVYGFLYFYAGYQKVILSSGISWIYENEILYNLLAIRDKGWLVSMPLWLQEIQYDYFKLFGRFGQGIILSFELGIGLILWNKRYLRILILLAMFLHVQVFVLNGALFWLWIGGGILMLRISKHVSKTYFSPKMAILGVLLMMFLGPVGIQIPKLAWYDSPLDNYFELEAKLESGVRKKISLGSIQPFTLHLQYGNILSTINSKNIYPGFLIIDKDVFQEVVNVEQDSILSLIDKNGVNVYREEMGNNLHEFLKSYLYNQQTESGVNSVMSWIQLPEYWNAHITDSLETVNPEDIKTLYLYHCSKYRYLDKADRLLWKDKVIEIER